jgi:protein-disulfide isomerase
MGKGERTTMTRGAREKIKEQQAAARAQERRRRAITYTAAGLAAVAALGAGIWYGVSKSQPEEAAGDLAPITVQPDGTVVMAKSGVEKPVLDVYEDFQCPACKEAERVSGQTIKNLAAEGKVKVVYHPITIFSQEPTRSNSLRAGNAARCVADGKQWLSFHNLLFQNQPSETAEGFTNSQLIEWGKEAGVTAPDFEQCVNSGKHAQAQLSYSEKIMNEQKLTHTPTLKLNGTEVDNAVVFSPSELRDAVTKAAK